jgi:multisubunit Na+/H+ antiporter MnhF subunit
VLARAEGREPFGVLAIVLVALSFAGTLIFLRFLERMR